MSVKEENPFRQLDEASSCIVELIMDASKRYKNPNIIGQATMHKEEIFECCEEIKRCITKIEGLPDEEIARYRSEINGLNEMDW